MGIPIDAKPTTSPPTTMNEWSTTSPSTMNATLPTPAQSPSPQKKWKGFPTPIADSCGDVFDIDAPPADDAPPPYAENEQELALALNNSPVETTIMYGSHILHGKIYYLPALFSQLYERLHDISPSDYPQLADEYCKPWAVMHRIEGMSWVNEKLLYLSGTNTTQVENQEPRFVAVTDSIKVLNHTELLELPLGNISMQGIFAAGPYLNASNDIIVALPCNKPLLGHSSAPYLVDRALMVRPVMAPEYYVRFIRIKDLTPAPATPDVLDAVRKVIRAGDHAENLTNGNPKETWLAKTLPHHFGESPTRLPTPAPSVLRPATSTSPSPAKTTPQKSATHGQRMTLNESSPLWPHRGNEALLKRSIWQQMCYPSGTNDTNVESKGWIKVPDAYSQVLFEDLQARKRVPGTEQLAGVAREWYGWVDGGSGEKEGSGVSKAERNESMSVSPGRVEGLLDAVGKAGSEEYAGESMEID